MSEAYSFQKDIEDLKWFYKTNLENQTFVVNALRNSSYVSDSSNTVITEVENKKERYEKSSRRNLVINLCAAWDKYVSELKVKEPEKHKLHFGEFSKWHSRPIKNVACIRHCLSHNNGVVDQDYIDCSKSKEYNIGDEIILTEYMIDEYITYFENAYQTITK